MMTAMELIILKEPCQYRVGRPEGPDYCQLNESLCDLSIGGQCDLPAEEAEWDKKE